MFLVSRALLALPTRDHGPKSHVGVQGWELEQRAAPGTVLGDGTGQGEASPARMIPLPFTNELSLIYMLSRSPRQTLRPFDLSEQHQD